jgi:hypothetical protein
MPCNSSPENRHRLDALAEALFQAETLEGPEPYGAAGLEPQGDYATQAPAPAEVGAEPVRA